MTDNISDPGLACASFKAAFVRISSPAIMLTKLSFGRGV